MSDLYMKLDDAVKRVNLLCKWEFGKDCVFDETILRQELEQICQIPSPVEVVRCKDCRHNGSFDTDCPFGWRDERFNLPDGMDYCSYGERKDDECK